MTWLPTLPAASWICNFSRVRPGCSASSRPSTGALQYWIALRSGSPGGVDETGDAQFVERTRELAVLVDVEAAGEVVDRAGRRGAKVERRYRRHAAERLDAERSVVALRRTAVAERAVGDDLHGGTAIAAGRPPWPIVPQTAGADRLVPARASATMMKPKGFGKSKIGTPSGV